MSALLPNLALRATQRNIEIKPYELTWKDGVMITAIAISAIACFIAFLSNSVILTGVFCILTITSIIGAHTVHKIKELKTLSEIASGLEKEVQKLEQLNKEVQKLKKLNTALSKTTATLLNSKEHIAQLPEEFRTTINEVLEKHSQNLQKLERKLQQLQEGLEQERIKLTTERTQISEERIKLGQIRDELFQVSQSIITQVTQLLGTGQVQPEQIKTILQTYLVGLQRTGEEGMAQV